jgi:hypothetical protein
MAGLRCGPWAILDGSRFRDNSHQISKMCIRTD